MGVKCSGLLDNQVHLTVVSAKKRLFKGGGEYIVGCLKKNTSVSLLKKTGISSVEVSFNCYFLEASRCSLSSEVSYFKAVWRILF